MSAILAMLLVVWGALAIILVAQSQQVVQVGSLSIGVTTFVTHLNAPPTTDSLKNDVNRYYDFIFRFIEKAVLDLHSACTFADYQSTSAPQRTSFSVVQLGDLTPKVALNFKNAVIFASDCVAHNSSTHAPTRAIGFADKTNFRAHNPRTCAITLFIDYYPIFRSARNK